jgi:hypothetical protein
MVTAAWETALVIPWSSSLVAESPAARLTAANSASSASLIEHDEDDPKVAFLDIPSAILLLRKLLKPSFRFFFWLL